MQVLVCTFGAEGIRRLASASYPKVEGVEYLVSWQLPDGDCEVPPELALRSDFKIIKNRSRGLSRNRNEALSAAEAPICLIADDDLNYDADALRSLMDYYRRNPDVELVCCHITIGGRTTATFSPEAFDLGKMPRGYYFTSCEISFRRQSVVDSGVRFEEMMGAGAPLLGCGEEEVFMRSLLRKGLQGVCLPVILCDHPQSTSGERLIGDPKFSMVQGALLRFRHRRSWIARIPWNALLNMRRTRRGYFESWRLLLQGARYSKRMKMFQ